MQKNNEYAIRRKYSLLSSPVAVAHIDEKLAKPHMRTHVRSAAVASHLFTFNSTWAQVIVGKWSVNGHMGNIRLTFITGYHETMNATFVTLVNAHRKLSWHIAGKVWAKQNNTKKKTQQKSSETKKHNQERNTNNNPLSLASFGSKIRRTESMRIVNSRSHSLCDIVWHVFALKFDAIENISVGWSKTWTHSLFGYFVLVCCRLPTNTLSPFYYVWIFSVLKQMDAHLPALKQIIFAFSIFSPTKQRQSSERGKPYHWIAYTCESK